MAGTLAAGMMSHEVFRASPRGWTYRLYRLRYAPAVKAWLDAPAFLVHVPKCAGMSLAGAMGRPDPGHIPVTDYPAEVRAALAGKPALCVLREPVERFVSAFRYSHQRRAAGRSVWNAEIAASPDIDTALHRLERSGGVAGHFFLRPAVDFIAAARVLGMDVHLLAFEHLGRAPEALDALGFPGARPGHVNRAPPLPPGLNARPSEPARRRLRAAYAADAALHRQLVERGGLARLADL